MEKDRNAKVTYIEQSLWQFLGTYVSKIDFSDIGNI